MTSARDSQAPFVSRLSSIVKSASGLLQHWGGYPAAAKTSAADPAAPSPAYENLVRRTFTARERATLPDKPLSRFVPKPLHEAFDHPQSRPDADAASLARDLFGRGGLLLGFVTIALTLLFIALASGIYAPSGKPAGQSPASAEPIQKPAPRPPPPANGQQQQQQQQQNIAPGVSK